MKKILALFVLMACLSACREAKPGESMAQTMQRQLKEDVQACKDQGLEPVLKMENQSGYLYVKYCVPSNAKVVIEE